MWCFSDLFMLGFFGLFWLGGVVFFAVGYVLAVKANG